MLFFNTLYFSLVAYAFFGLRAAESEVPWSWDLRVAVPVFIALCFTGFQGAVSTHNAVHSPLFKVRNLNKLYQCVLTLTYGHPVSSYVPGHNLSHHKHTQTRSDVMRTTKARFRWNFLNLIFFMPIIGSSIMRADTSYAKLMRTRHPKWFQQLMAEFAILWAVQIALFVVDWRKALVFWLVPHLYAQWGIVTMNLLQHDGCDQETEYNHSRNFVGQIINYFTFNNGFHTIHHMVPGLHWSLTPAAHAERVAPHIHPNLDQKSMVRYLLHTYLFNNRDWYDGTKFILPEEGPDEEWLPDPRTTLEDLGAESLDSGHGGLAAHVAHRSSASR